MGLHEYHSSKAASHKTEEATKKTNNISNNEQIYIFKEGTWQNLNIWAKNHSALKSIISFKAEAVCYLCIWPV